MELGKSGYEGIALKRMSEYKNDVRKQFYWEYFDKKKLSNNSNGKF